MTNQEAMELLMEHNATMAARLEGTEDAVAEMEKLDLMRFVWIVQKSIEYLSETACSVQTKEHLTSFLSQVPEQLTAIEKLQIVNVRPTTLVEMYTVRRIRHCLPD